MTTQTPTITADNTAVMECTRKVQVAVLAFAAHQHLTCLLNCIEAMRNLIEAKGYRNGYQDNSDIDGNAQHVVVRVHIIDQNHENVKVLRFLHDYAHESMTALVEHMRTLAAEVIALPPHDEHQRAVWKGKLNVLAEEGEKLNMGFEYTQMLRATAEKLAKNALAAPVGEMPLT